MNTIQSKALVGIGGSSVIALRDQYRFHRRSTNYVGEAYVFSDNFGIGNPPGTVDMKAFLLQRLSTVDRHQIDAALDQGVEAVSTLVLNGFDQTITSFNLRQKYKYHKV